MFLNFKVTKLIAIFILLFTLLSGVLIKLGNENIRSSKTANKTNLQDSLQIIIDQYYEQINASITNAKTLTNARFSKEANLKELKDNKEIKRFNKLRLITIDSILDSLKNKGVKLSMSNVDSLHLIHEELKGYLLNIDSTIENISKRLERLSFTIDDLINIDSKITQKISSLLSKINYLVRNYEGDLQLKIKGKRVSIFIMNMTKQNINLHLNNKFSRNYFYFDSVKSYLNSKNHAPLMITNAGMFNPSYHPVGLYIENAGKALQELDTSLIFTGDNFYLHPNGVFYVDTNNIPSILTTTNFSSKYHLDYLSIKMATQSGPMLVIDNKIHPKFTQTSINFKIRSGVGVIDHQRVVFAVTLDKFTFYDFAETFKDIFACQNALFLDGQISKMYLKGYPEIEYSGMFGPIISITEK